MFNGWMSGFLAGIQTINQILTAGIAITALSLFLYALSFNLRDRVARSFSLILLCVVVVFTTEALQSKTSPEWGIELLLRLQWLGIVYLPAAYLQLSDALMVTAGRPSRGRRRLVVRVMYLISTMFLVLHSFGLLLGPLVPKGQPAPHLQRTLLTEVFTIYYVVAMVWAGVNFIRAYSRMLTRSGRRRMFYLMAGATAPALGSYPYLLYGYSLAGKYPLLFWSASVVINLLVGGLVVIMAYAVAFFGVSWPDRVVKTRLFKWLMRGPVTTSITLALMTVVRRGGELMGMSYSVAVPAIMVASVLLLEHSITLISPIWERWFFYGRDRQDLQLLQKIEERLVTRSDLNQFMEAVLAAVRDHMQSPSAFVAALNGDELTMIIIAGNKNLLDQDQLSNVLKLANVENNGHQEFIWGNFLILPLRQHKPELDRDEVPPLLGLMGVAYDAVQSIERDQRDSLWLLAERAALALEDRRSQQAVFNSLEDLQPQVDIIQRLRAVGRYDSMTSLLADTLPPESDLANWVKDALVHYWGGPKLTTSPLLHLQIVQDMSKTYNGNVANGLRAVLRKAVDQTRPMGERRFTAEWILYNILEMKFIEGRKVREVASRLAMSEADLYRKQRVAVEAVAKVILDMEDKVLRTL